MTVWLLALGLMLILMAGMAVGVIFSNKPIAGSCGGLNKLGLKEGCEVCGGNDQVCEEENRKRSTMAERRASDANRGMDLGYDATRR
ncbi:(Na+)-NQR maturation NqrM [Pistricoccus aurantiacus]|uniref:(Na+)-NQR maturation NqrM n=1 Tax=Pistricoccus aurantiacus TaxID=1883414 RepID=A0A5B8ST84_9GAMM|nr:(Na+)-NQR maturation NqrM [Pistricoccus aurantiacus]QEA40289.1 (Na+)-NQR maturation NqrM [Pistricoccus aurantiacus]